MNPNYLCIGVQKSGTTSLINYLNQNPDIFMKKNESHFFDKPISKEGMKAYKKSFITKKPLVGEKTPSYCYLRYAIDQIYKFNKNMKLIIILREPISRAYSHFNMDKQKGKNSKIIKSDDDIVKFFRNQENDKLTNKTWYRAIGENMAHLIRGYYDEILKYIFSKFPRENVYIGISEEINKDKLKYYNEIFTFLGARKLKKIDENLNTHIRTYSNKIPNSLERYLYNIYKSHNEELYKILGKKINIWEDYYNKIKKEP